MRIVKVDDELILFKLPDGNEWMNAELKLPFIKRDLGLSEVNRCSALRQVHAYDAFEIIVGSVLVPAWAGGNDERVSVPPPQSA